MTEPILTGHKGFTVRGLSARTQNAHEAEAGSAKIPGLWQRYLGDGGAGSIPGALDAPVSIAVYTEYESDQDGAYTLVLGAPLVDGDAAAETHDTVAVPDGSYLLFTAQGEMPQALISTWMKIHAFFAADPPYRRLYAADFELHDASTPQRVEVYVGVK